MGRGMLSKSLAQFSVDGQACVPSLLFDLRPNYGGGSEDNGSLLQKLPCTFCCTQGPRRCSRPPQIHASTRNSWTLKGQIWVSLFWGHCFFLLGPGAHKSLFPQSRVSSLIKSHWPPKSNSLGVRSLFARSAGWEISCGF